jgi:TrpR-related protein YerC/YecD
MKEVDWKNKLNTQLLEAFLAIRNRDEAKRFLRDILTAEEINEFAARLEAARLLSRDAQYNAIIDATGLSSRTIARISKWLRGSLGGYRIILPRLNHSPNSSLQRKGLRLSS